METAFNVSLEGGKIVNAVPRLTAVSDMEALDELKTLIDAQQESFLERLREVGRFGLSAERQSVLKHYCGSFTQQY